MKQALLLLVVLGCSHWAYGSVAITNTATYNAFWAGPPSEKTPFALTGLVLRADAILYDIQDATGRAEIFNTPAGVKPGQIVGVRGWVQVRPADHEPVTYRDQQVEILGKGEIPAPLEVSVGELDPQRHDLCEIATVGTVVDVIPDDIDSKYDILLLRNGTASLPVFIEKATLGNGARLVDATVKVWGCYRKRINGKRRNSGPYLSCRRVSVVSPPPQDPFDVPCLEATVYLGPQQVSRLGHRRIRGEVLAVYRESTLVVASDDGRIVNVRLQHGASVPRAGETVTVVGFPATDFFRINLESARVRVDSSVPPAPARRPLDVTERDIVQRVNGRLQYESLLHGRLVRVRGTVREIGDIDERGVPLVLGANASVRVDTGCCRKLFENIPPGSEAEVTGICYVEVDVRGRHELFSRISGISLVPRSADDVAVIRTPPWWTPTRLMAVIVSLAGVLFVILVGGFYWNRLLRRLVDRRGRELVREQVRASASALKVDERTRLAVELHDTLSQNLAGVAFQVSSVTDILEKDPREARKRLETADRMLKSCRSELTDCLFDLRSSALECRLMDEAIRVSLGPLVEEADVVIRFPASRATLLDSTVHAVICIVRELVSNAIRHGAATEIGIDGVLDAAGVRFSVRDNGSGFDPALCADMATGHFGLSGIRDRVDRLGGAFEIESAPGLTKASVFLPRHTQGNHE